MGAVERQEHLLEILCTRKYDTYDNLARDLGVSKMTVRRDVQVLMCHYPIETVHGGRHGGVKVMDGYHLKSKPKSLSREQAAFLQRIRGQFTGKDHEILNSILVQFAP